METLLTSTSLTQNPAWQRLEALSKRGDALDLRTLFAADAKRFNEFSISAPQLLVDFSKQRINKQVLSSLLGLARERELDAWRDQLFAGAQVNNTEGRAVMHWALRGAPSAPHENVNAAVKMASDVRAAFLKYTDEVRARGAIHDVVNIGIGGSDLGPRMAVAALQPYTKQGIRSHFVANVDAHDLVTTLQGLKPEHTLFVICSKTFTTRETLLNAKLAKDWFVEQGGKDVAAHFVGVTTNVAAAKAFGIETTFPFWDWVGGRYSMWSSIGLSIALAVGSQAFEELLQGAAEMDAHFAATPLEKNAPVLLALLELWNRNFQQLPTRCVAPYHHGLRLLPAYLQQLEMESNGKSVTREGKSIDVETCGVVWGEAGTNAQHSFFQMLHQGTQVVPVEFILVRKPHHAHDAAHRILLANALAQSQALMQGKTAAVAATEKVPTAGSDVSAEALSQHRTFSGNRPSTSIVLDSLTPRALGALIALYEHKTFVLSVLWGINAFDQWGVELGKSLALDIEQRFESSNVSGLDGSTAGLMRHLKA